MQIACREIHNRGFGHGAMLVLGSFITEQCCLGSALRLCLSSLFSIITMGVSRRFGL
jgi:hypothetical protein